MNILYETDDSVTEETAVAVVLRSFIVFVGLSFSLMSVHNRRIRDFPQRPTVTRVLLWNTAIITGRQNK